MRIATLIGIDDYLTSPLSGCVKDASRLSQVLSTHHDGSPNFDCRTMLSSDSTIDRAQVRNAITELFEKPADLALFYFAGHGMVKDGTGILVTQDAKGGDEGVSFDDLLKAVSKSPAKEKAIILDCCHGGAVGNLTILGDNKTVPAETCFLAGCRDTETAAETARGGLFTSLVVSALEGAGADAGGKVTIANVYTYADDVLSGWDQRPTFSANVSSLFALRNCSPAVPLDVIRLLPLYFPKPNHEYTLDPSYEPSVDPRDADHERIFGHLQKLRDARMLVPVGADALYFAAVDSTACKLTMLGQFYWERANAKRI